MPPNYRLWIPRPIFKAILLINYFPNNRKIAQIVIPKPENKLEG